MKHAAVTLETNSFAPTVHRFRDDLGNTVYVSSGGGLFVVPDAPRAEAGGK